jgi:hypothetical protein
MWFCCFVDDDLGLPNTRLRFEENGDAAGPGTRAGFSDLETVAITQSTVVKSYQCRWHTSPLKNLIGRARRHDAGGGHVIAQPGSGPGVTLRFCLPVLTKAGPLGSQ